MANTVQKPPGSDVDRLFELVYDLGDALVDLTAAVGALSARLRRLEPVEPEPRPSGLRLIHPTGARS